MNVPPFFARKGRAVWAGLGLLALAQAAALVAAVTGTRLAFGGLDSGRVPPLAVGLIAGAALALAILRPALRLLAERLGHDQTAEIRAELYRHAMAVAPERQARSRRGYVMLRLTGDMRTLKDGIARTLPPLLQGAALIPAAVLALALIDLRFGLAGLALAGVSLSVIGLSRPSLHRAHAALRSERAKLVADLAERLPIASDLVRLGRRQSELSRLEKANRTLHERSHARLLRVEGLRALPGALAGLAAVGVLLDGVSRGLTAGEIAVALAAIGMMTHAIVEVATAVDRLTGWQVARKNLDRHLAQGAAAADAATGGQVRLTRATGAVAIEAEGDALCPATLRLSPGERIAITGADPDRMLRVLAGQASDPRVLVQLDGTALPDLSPGSLRRNIGILDASAVLLKGSVRRNICLGLSERPSDATLMRRIGRAGLGQALDQLGGLDGAVPEAGPLLGLAQRLRLSALRTAVQNPSVLLVNDRCLPLPEDVQGYLEGTRATVIRIGPRADQRAQAPQTCLA